MTLYYVLNLTVEQKNENTSKENSKIEISVWN